MITHPVAAGGCAVLLACTLPAAGEEAWTATGLDTPESALYDADRDVLYVSNIAGALDEKDGNGFISRLGTDGSLRDLEWVAGLDAPKGLALHDGTLYVTDIDRLVAIDVERAAISGTWPAEGAVFFNDAVAGADGRIYVSDTVTNRIHVLDGDSFTIWLEDAGLAHPNGLHLRDGQLIVGSWGEGLKDDFSTEKPGHLLAVDLATKAITPLTGDAIGNLDGVEPDGAGGWLVTDFIAGGLYHIAADGSVVALADLNQGSADLEFLPDARLAIVPMMLDGTVVAHRLE
jgi:sugar lactone lactonase YvrE